MLGEPEPSAFLKLLSSSSLFLLIKPVVQFWETPAKLQGGPQQDDLIYYVLRKQFQAGTKSEHREGPSVRELSQSVLPRLEIASSSQPLLHLGMTHALSRAC